MNDFDIKDQVAIATDLCIRVFKLIKNDTNYEIEPVTILNKHESIVLKVLWSKTFPNQLYSIGFDYKLVHHTLTDQSKTTSRNIIQSMLATLGPGSEKLF